MFPLVNEVGKRLVKYLTETNSEKVEAKEISLKYTTDVVASCMFGIEGNSFEDGKGELLAIGKKIFTPSIILGLKHFIVAIMPYLANFLNFKVFPDEVFNYFHVIIRKSLKYREQHRIVRGDFIDSMKDLRSKLGSDNFKDDNIVGHAGSLFGDGFETSAISLSFNLFELAKHPEIQSNLRAVIDDIKAKNNGEFTYEDIIGLPYLEGVFKESLRLHPPATFIAKICTKDFTLPSPYYGNESHSVEIKEGLPIIIPIYALHRDAKYFTDPEEFIPERHLEEDSDRPYLTFGSGPRYCLGEKFAVMQVKAAIAYLVSHFEIRLNKKTILPLQMDPQYFLLRPKTGIWLDFHKIK